MNNNITIIIKTFIRLNCVKRQLDSIANFYPQMPIIICDDSVDSENNKKTILEKYKNLNISYIITEENIGLAKGRNILVDKVKTKYFLLCDDDFIFYKKTNLECALFELEKNNLDILGGLCLNAFRINYGTKKEKIQLFMRKCQELFHHYRKVGYSGKIVFDDNKITIITKKLNYFSKQVYKTDICENFFLGKTDVVKELRWNDKLKLNEHEEFFIRAKRKGVKIGVTPLFKVLHYPESNVAFGAHRDVNYYKFVLMDSNINELKIYRNNVGIIQTYSMVNDDAVETREYTKNILGFLKKIYYKLK